MPQPLRIEDSDRRSHISSRTDQSRLWFINDAQLELDTLAYAALLQDRYDTKLFALSLMGNHHHIIGQFYDGTRADFNRDLKSQIQRFLKRSEKSGFVGGRLWDRRYDEQCLPMFEDIEHYFWYVVLQEVRAGRCDSIEECDHYNCFFDAISGVEREFKYLDYSSYQRAQRRNPNVSKDKFTQIYRLRYERLPGYEHLTQEEYRAMMMKKYKEQLAIALKERAERGFPHSMSKEYQRRMKPGSYPRTTKVSSRSNPRPIVLTLCSETRRDFLDNYYATREAHYQASQRFQNGELAVEYPRGTFRPPLYLFGRLERRRKRAELIEEARLANAKYPAAA